MRIVAYVVLSRSIDSFDLWMVCGTLEHAVNTYRKFTGKPGAITRTERGPEGHPVHHLDEPSNWEGIIAVYHVDAFEMVNEEHSS